MRSMLFYALLLVALLFNLTCCAQPWLDHPTSGSLERELAERSKHGLALARFSSPEPSLELRFFDARKEVLQFGCCPPTEGRTISRNRVVMMDMTNSPALDPFRGPPAAVLTALQLHGGQVVVMDTQGTILARSDVWFQPSIVALSPDEKHFALVGVPRGQPVSDLGLYVAEFQDKQARKLMSVTYQVQHDGRQPPEMTVDWSPDGQSVLFSYEGAVLLVDPQTAQSRKIADGGASQWSPTGEWISYITPQLEPALLNLATGESKLINPGKPTGSPLEWSPDGKYLLIHEGEGSHVPYGCLWVYRISDGAFVPILGYGMTNPKPHWIQIHDSHKLTGKRTIQLGPYAAN